MTDFDPSDADVRLNRDPREDAEARLLFSDRFAELATLAKALHAASESAAVDPPVGAAGSLAAQPTTEGDR